ncbi:hypothetical protein ALI22I_20225 [Saccharothrix sp. ALI-22-I]|uniref:hypothetical protein n=1 Tax=Saccharothrix sp. ALI-22-I TaxID=1933778 RepID=UPI00097C5533|nr:hypothetical protein [Saccharothrix sp. ALI-22-I]ONI88069.1 hypothetical protein ALI22I_20225 [Saccharothrix sp. ALI-22-I]
MTEHTTSEHTTSEHTTSEHVTAQRVTAEHMPADTGPAETLITRIPVGEIDRLVEDGQATRWTEPAGGLLVTIVEIGGWWWGLREGSDAYERLSEEESARLTHFRTAFELRERARAEVAAMTAPSTGAHSSPPR